MLESINLGDWLKKDEILRMLTLNKGKVVNERAFRIMVKEHNKKFINHEKDYFIAHSSKGYKATTDKDEILASVKDKRKRALDMLYENAQVLKALNENCNIKIIITKDNFMVVDDNGI